MAVKYVYADCAASAPILPCAMEAMRKSWGNPNSSHSSGREARAALKNARSVIARCIGAKPEQIGFTPSATEAARIVMPYFNICSISEFEHKCVRETAGFCDILGFKDTKAVAHILANNETGVVYAEDVKELSRHYAVFTDATAAVGQIPIDVRELGVAALSAGAHKFGGYPGIGFLYLRDGITDDISFPGTPPVALAVAMANALEYRTDYIGKNLGHLLIQRGKLVEGLMKIEGATINGLHHLRLPNIVSVRFDGIDARELLTLLDVNGVYASAGAACSADDNEPSPVLLASGLTEEQARSTIRLSFCPENTAEDFDFVLEAVSRCVAQLRKLAV